jgi:hypothetical protein
VAGVLEDIELVSGIVHATFVGTASGAADDHKLPYLAAKHAQDEFTKIVDLVIAANKEFDISQQSTTSSVIKIGKGSVLHAFYLTVTLDIWGDNETGS